MTILVAIGGLTKLHKERLQSETGDHEVIFLDELKLHDVNSTIINCVDIIVGNVPTDWLNSANRLRWIQLDSVGVDQYARLALNGRKPDFQITNLSDVLGQPVAETAMAGILALYRQLPRLLEAQRACRWVRKEVNPDMKSLHGACALILGMGSIGRRLKTIFTTFNCKVVGFARRSNQAQLHSLSELDDYIPKADIVINSLPQTPETNRILNRERLALFRRQSILVNVGRGSAVDEMALVDMLHSGQIGGAVLDVTQVEPLHEKHALWNHQNVILTQHTGGRFQGEADGKISFFLDNLLRFERQEMLEGLVDLSRGY